MLIISGGKTFSALEKAVDRVMPASTSCFTPVRMRRSSGLSDCSAMMDSARSMVRPALIMVANWRAKTDRSLSLMRFLRPKLISRCMPALTCRTSSGTYPIARSLSATAASETAWTLPSEKRPLASLTL
jgi:hypothetical protein